jgi:hypothetical protein
MILAGRNKSQRLTEIIESYWDATGLDFARREYNESPEGREVDDIRYEIKEWLYDQAKTDLISGVEAKKETKSAIADDFIIAALSLVDFDGIAKMLIDKVMDE